MNRKSVSVALVMVWVIIATWVMPVQAITEEETARFNTIRYVQEGIASLKATGQMSSNEIHSVYVDITYVPQGSVTATVYGATYQQPTVTTYTNILPQSITGVNGANDKLTRFLHYFGNNNRDVIVASSGSLPDETIIGYVYGERKGEILNAYVAGIPECLGNIRLYDHGVSSGSSDTQKTIDKTKTGNTPKNPEAWAEKYLATTFTINTATYSVINTNDSTTTETAGPEVKTMDVKPYIKENRTYVPVRYLAYSLGVPENGVTWNSKTQSIGITKENTRVGLTIGNNIMTINGASKFMDVAPEITSDRTMLPARWVAEALGATVKWDKSLNQTIIIMPAQ